MSDDYQENNDSTQSLVIANQNRPERHYLLPTDERPFMPGLVQPVLFNLDHWQRTAARLGQTPHRTLGLVEVAENDDGTLHTKTTPDYGHLVPVHHASTEGDSSQSE